jgi:hypothetical protein
MGPRPTGSSLDDRSGGLAQGVKKDLVRKLPNQKDLTPKEPVPKEPVRLFGNLCVRRGAVHGLRICLLLSDLESH